MRDLIIPVGLAPAVRQREVPGFTDRDNRNRVARVSTRITGNAVTVEAERHIAGDENTVLQRQVAGKIVNALCQHIIAVRCTPRIAALCQRIVSLFQFCCKISLGGLLRRAGAAAGVIIIMRRTAGTAKIVCMPTAIVTVIVIVIVGTGCRSGQQRQAQGQRHKTTQDTLLHRFPPSVSSPPGLGLHGQRVSRRGLPYGSGGAPGHLLQVHGSSVTAFPRLAGPSARNVLYLT